MTLPAFISAISRSKCRLAMINEKAGSNEDHS